MNIDIHYRSVFGGGMPPPYRINTDRYRVTPNGGSTTANARNELSAATGRHKEKFDKWMVPHYNNYVGQVPVKFDENLKKEGSNHV